ncbi:DUF3617 domain-containing protein [Qipengyuania sphaerica]|uniref:DUF3617 domain-containing protein n=1 Tax=Qipengyuania sphaerica TaxID=2867243 RepID=UPI001C879235|nr:DUF3617 family protein [Qipengyuania sphaerica]MBX7540085.1 DUF3617 domain-containing protein [Qipengyuania sphaerica]
MLRIVTVAAAALALAACSSSDDVDADGDGTVSAEEAKNAAAKVRPLEPGEYKMSMELVEIVDPTMSEEEIAQARKFFSAMSGMAPAKCLSEEEASEGMTGIAEGLQKGDCTTDKLTANSDGMQGEMTCKGDNGPAKVTIDTTSTGTESMMTMSVTEPTGEGSDKKVTMKIGMTRTGDCTPNS